MKKRLSDTASIVGVSTPTQVNESVSVSVKKIDNGYVKSVSRWGDDGEHSCSEKFSTSRPALEVGEPAKREVSGALRSAIEKLK